MHANGTPRRLSPREVLKQLKQTELPDEHLEVEQFMLLLPGDRMELLYRMLNRLAIAVQGHSAQFPLIDEACREMADAINALQGGDK